MRLAVVAVVVYMRVLTFFCSTIPLRAAVAFFVQLTSIAAAALVPQVAAAARRLHLAASDQHSFARSWTMIEKI